MTPDLHAIVPIVNRPDLVRAALLCARSPVIADLECTGLTRHDSIVSAGLLITNRPYILFVRSRVCPNIPLDQFVHALRPLETRTDITTVYHNAAYDLGMFWREGIRVGGIVHDSELMLRIIDSDRGRSADVLSARVDRCAPPGAPYYLNYRLKYVVPQLLGIGMVNFPDTEMDWLPYEPHIRYLTSDLLGTKALYDYLIDKLTPEQRSYYDQYVAPLTPLLTAMSEAGVPVDRGFVCAEVTRLRAIITNISDAHLDEFGLALTGLNRASQTGWLFGTLGLAPTQYTGKQRTPSLKSAHLRALKASSTDPRVVRSIDLIVRHRVTAQCLRDIIKLERAIDWRDNKIHTQLRDTQASGRISSKKPNLQGISKVKEVGDHKSVPRNVLVAAPGEVLVSVDIKQADVRVLAHGIATFPRTAEEHIDQLRAARLDELAPEIRHYLDKLPDYRNPDYCGPKVEPPNFDPARHDALGAVLALVGGDPYTDIAAQITGVPASEVSNSVRKVFKAVTLGMVNSITPTGLAKQLGYGESTAAKAKARQHVVDFYAAYPQVKAYTETQRWSVALTGETTTWAGRTRTCSAHRWMVTFPRVELLCSFNSGREWLDLDVHPLRPGRYCLTVWIRKAWDATYRSHNHGKLIYEDTRGPLCTYPYRLFQDADLLYRLPVRNVSLRSIRRVRTPTEEAQYFGFDATARSLVNSIYQGGTRDIAVGMLLNSRPLCNQYYARLLLNIHDELVLTCPESVVTPFARVLKAVLEQPPAPHFRVPIRVDVNAGSRFGEMVPIRDI